MNIKFVKEKNYNFHYITVENFRHSSIGLVFTAPFEPKKTVAFSLLTDILTEGSKDFPSRKYTVRYMDEHYMYDFYGSFTKIGKSIQAIISCDYIDSKYVDDEENYLDTVYKFVFETISNPLVINNGFDEKIFNSVKQRHIKGLRALDGNNRFIANNRAINLYSKDPEISFHMHDMIDYIESLTPQDLYEAYKEFVKSTSIDVFIMGSDNISEVQKLVKKYFPFKETCPYKKYEEMTKTEHRGFIKKKFEKSSYKQSNVYLIYNLSDPTMFEREYVSSYYLNILCDGGLNSKLHKSLRTDAQLCYGVGASYWDRSKILVINSTVRVGKEKLAIKLMKKCVKEMITDISDDEFTGAYYSIQRGLKGVTDSMGAMGRIYLNNYFSNFSTYEEKLVKSKHVKISQIKSFAQKFKLNTVYVLKGDINERTED